jgi:uncharacterized membrane protein
MDRATLLANIPLFEHVDEADLASLDGHFEERSFDAGQEVFHQGSEGATLFVILDGAVEISVGEDKARTVLSTLFQGHHFGELSLFDGQPRSATATVVKPSKLLALAREDFVEYLRTHPDAAIAILREMGERVRQTNDLMSRQVSRDVLAEDDEKLTFGQRVADGVAAFGGSWSFIGLFAGVMVFWMGVNAIEKIAWDPMPFILLNLILSTIAALQAPVIMMSQNRQSAKDKLLAQNDYIVNVKAEMGIERLLKGQAEIVQRLSILEHAAHRAPGQGPGSATGGKTA